VRHHLLVVAALIAGATLGYFGPGFVMAASRTEIAIAAPDPDPKNVNPPKAGQSYGCDPLADANVFDDRFSYKATVWTGQSPSKLAIQIGDDGKKLLLLRATNVEAGVVQPEEFKITLNGASYMMAQEQLTLASRW
jgi:hypothetical protein